MACVDSPTVVIPMGEGAGAPRAVHPVGAGAVRPARYPVTANRGARGLILTRVFAVTLALD